MNSSPAPEFEEGGNPLILVVDDDEMVRDVVVESIRAAGLPVDFCADASAALKMSRRNPYDLIVTDMRLPGMDGLELIRELKASNQDTDVIVITGHATVENAVECMKAGALDYIIKPFTVDQIQIAVSKALEHRDLRTRALEREFYRELSYVDSLTGVYNRRFFDEALAAQMGKSAHEKSTMGLLMIDIDDFKIYNDRFGHLTGDKALTGIGGLLKSVCRVTDIVARYGGEEFTVIFPGADKTTLPELTDRIMSSVRTFSFEGADTMPSGALTVSIGAACFPEDAENPAELIRCADKAMYSAKETGKNKVTVYNLSQDKKRIYAKTPETI